MASFWGEIHSDRALEILLARPARCEGALIDEVLTQTDASVSEGVSMGRSESACMTGIIELKYKALVNKRTKVHRSSRKA